MFVISALLAAFGLAITTSLYAALREGRGRIRGALAVVGVTIAIIVSAPALMSPVILLQGVVLMATALLAFAIGAQTRTFLAVGASETFCILFGLGILGIGVANGLQARFPFESLAERLAYEQRRDALGSSVPKPPSARRAQVERMSRSYDSRDGYRATRREQALRLIHASQFEKFVSSPGFGVGRGNGPGFWTLESADLRAPPPIPARGESPASPFWVSEHDESAAATPISDYLAQQLTPLHEASTVEFVNPAGFGWKRDLEHVAGFRAHGFHSPTTATFRTELKLRRLELVSLLKHDPPRAYVSTNLPNMDELRRAPTRELDPFETRSLAKLRDGSELESEQFPGRVRALGAIVAVQQCVQCHAVGPGELLGAFSYEFDDAGGAREAAPAAPNQRSIPES